MAPDAEPARYDLSCEVDPYRSGWTLGAFLAHRFRYHPPEIWTARIVSGDVQVNGETADAQTPVSAGDRVTYTVLHREPEVDFRHEVLHEDEHVLAVAKSGNLPVHGGGKFIRHTLIARLRAERGDELRLAHRLDRETSGVVLLAKTVEAARFLEQEFRARRVGKTYRAILRGEFPPERIVEAPIARVTPPVPPYRRVVDSERGKPARTRFRLLAAVRRGGRSAAAEDLPLSLVEALPESGRTNQIRVHAAHLGHPVLGDKIYGIPEELAREFVREGETERVLAAAGAPRHLLHCARLEIAHPAGGAPLDLRAAPPRDFGLFSGGPILNGR